VTRNFHVHPTQHHGSHRGLLYTAPNTSPQVQVDAIIVPTIRRPQAMVNAITLAANLNCVLVALCSGKYTSGDAVARLAAPHGIEILAVNMDKIPAGLLPEFKTTAQLENTRFEQRTDISLKRNLGLLIARVAGWERIVFLDDDIEVPNPLDLRRAAALTDDHAGAGLTVRGYPDNSVVCHAYREAGGAQDTFVGGGALAVHTRNMSSFFPAIYNEDWFFLLGGEKLRPTAATGVAIQKPYDPFAEDRRARMEEFGDLLAEGLFWLLDEGRSLRDADLAYWTRYLEIRNNFILETVEMVRSSDGLSERKSRMLSSLKAARGRSQYIRPEWCEDYIRNWRTDRKIWRQHVERIQPSRRRNYCKGDLSKVVAHLGLACQSTYLVGQRLDHHVADLHNPVSAGISG
jgi:hypothetical protein